jgi:hypothetical protein
MSHRIFIVLTVAAICCGSCARQSAPLATLPSGKQIKITGEGTTHFSNGTDALVLNCETDISIDDMSDLRKEVDEIWKIFRNTLERTGMSNGVIRMTHPEDSGLVTQGKSCAFVFEKQSNGQWHCLQDEKK